MNIPPHVNTDHVVPFYGVEPRIGAPQQLQEPELDIRFILSLLTRQLKLIAATTILIISVVAVALFAVTPTYTATALLLVDTSGKNLLEPAAAPANASGDSARVDSEVEILQSDSVLLDVIGSVGLIGDVEFGVRPSLRDRLAKLLRLDARALPTGQEALGGVLRRLKDHTSIRRRGLTHIIAVDVSSTDPDKAALLANALAKSYTAAQVRAKIESTLVARDIVDSQIDRAKDAIVTAEQAFDGYIENNLGRIAAATGRSDLSSMRDEIEMLSRARADALRKVEDVRQGVARSDWNAVASTLRSQALAELTRQRGTLAKTLAGTPEGSRAALDLKAELKKIDVSLAAESRAGLAALEGEVAGDDRRSAEARRALTDAILDADLPADILAQIYGLQQTSRNAAGQYQTLLARSQDLATQSELQVADSRLVSPALAPDRPSFPNVPLALALGGLCGLGIGIGLGFLRENYIGGFTTEDQVEAVAGFPVSASVPQQEQAKDARSVADTIVALPLSRYAESLRRLRAAIDRTSKTRTIGSVKRRGLVVVVSSAVPAEGKTTVALSLARTYALSGMRTVIVDADMRKPSLHHHFGVKSSIGLVDLLTDTLPSASLASIVVNDPLTPLVGVVGTRRSDLPTDRLVMTPAFAHFIAFLRDEFDVVIVDSPPVEPIVDGIYLAPFADLIAFVIHWATTPQRAVVGALAALDAAKADDAKVVVALNQDERRSLSYGSAYSDYYIE